MFKKIVSNILIKLWCKDVCLMLYGLKHFNLNLLLDSIFFWKYRYVWDNKLAREFASKYTFYLDNKNYKKKLIKWLDCESIKNVNQIEFNINQILKNRRKYINLVNFWITENPSKIKNQIDEYTKDMYLPINHKEQTVFYFKHGISYVENLKTLINWKDILDCWAFIGDSALMFSKELWFKDEGGVIKNIFCLEPDYNNGKLLEKTIINNSLTWKVIPIALWVWKKKENLYIKQNWSTSTVWFDWWDIIKIDKIDNIVRDYWIKPWLIKWDIEWLEYDSILWAKIIIKQYKPILLISIYHNWRDFYQIKPLLESRNLWYKFKIRRLSIHPFFETMLICY